MKTNIVVAILVVALGVLAVTVVRQYRELTDLKKSLQVAEAKAAAAKQIIVRPSPVERPVKPRAERAVVTEPAAVSSSEAGTNAPAQKPANFFAGISSMAKDPAMRGMIRSQQKMSFDMLYGGLFKELNLPAEQLDAFKELMLDRQMAMMDVSLGMMGGEMSATDRTQKGKELEAIKSSYDKKIEEFLGADGYGVFKDYEQTQPERMQVNLFKHSLASADV
jgi:hypothetical protein